MSNRITASACGSISGVAVAASRLGLAIDDLELEPDLLGDAGAEFAAVGRGAAGLGRDQPRARVRAMRILSRQMASASTARRSPHR